MATFYTDVDQERYDAGEKFLPQNRFLLDYTTPTTNVEEEEVTTSYGIPNTNAFINSGGGGNNVGLFDPYTAQSYVTNRTDFNRTGYLPGLEPPETNMNKIGALVKKGIGMAIPGGNFLMGMADNFSRENRLNTVDNAFIDMQLGIKEKSMYGGNLENQDRYGFNKTSMFGNYADKVKERVEIANKRIADGKDLRDIDSYYLEKEKELDETEKQVEFNNFLDQRIAANKFRDLQAQGIDLYPDGKDIHGGDDTITTTTTTTDQSGTGGDGGGPGSWGGHGSVEAYDKANQATYDRISDMHNFATGGRVGLRYGGLLSIL